MTRGEFLRVFCILTVLSETLYMYACYYCWDLPFLLQKICLLFRSVHFGIYK